MADMPFLPDFTTKTLPDLPGLEFCFEIELKFAKHDSIAMMPSGAGRGFVYLGEGEIRGPRLQGRVMPYSGGDWALFRPDDVLQTDARYMLEATDGTKILMHNRGYLWGRETDTIKRMQDWMFRDGPPIGFDEFYLRSAPTFETEKGPHEWLMRHIFIGVGQRSREGNLLRYYALM